MKLYIAGKVSKDSSFKTHYWRDGFSAELSKKSGLKIINIDPTKSAAGFKFDHTDSKLIYGRNCYMINMSDVVVVYLSDDISVGGSQEMLIAKYYGKPLIGLAPKGGKFNLAKKEIFGRVYKKYVDPYVFIACDKVVGNMTELAKALKKGDWKKKKVKNIKIIDESLRYYKQNFLKQDKYLISQ
ncbi:MAG: hypothetical protein WCT08_06005 [Patescibacteria group bacterium]|jgi:hypothetical protein